jgi:arginyl-tRNA synthetase
LIFLQAFRRAGWLPRMRTRIQNDGKRFRSRSSEVVRLVDLLDEAKRRCKTALLERGNVQVVSA